MGIHISQKSFTTGCNCKFWHESFAYFHAFLEGAELLTANFCAGYSLKIVFSRNQLHFIFSSKIAKWFIGVGPESLLEKVASFKSLPFTVTVCFKWAFSTYRRVRSITEVVFELKKHVTHFLNEVFLAALNAALFEDGQEGNQYWPVEGWHA